MPVSSTRMAIAHKRSDDMISKDTRSDSLSRELNQLGVSVSTERVSQLLFLAERKYNRYDLYAPGETFQSRLLQWLQNFDRNDRQAAMEVVFSLTFVGQSEMKALITASFSNMINIISGDLDKLPTTSAMTYLDARTQRMQFEVSKALFIAMSDDVRFDFFRRNAQQSWGILKKDNFVEYYKLHADAQIGLEDHSRIFLVGQLSGSGITSIRLENDDWNGKIPNFFRYWSKDAQECAIYYCPYIMSSKAERNLRTMLHSWAGKVRCKRVPELLPTSRIPIASCLRSKDGSSIDPSRPVAQLCEKYHKSFIGDEHIEKGGPCQFGFGSAGLSLVLHTNCPNNSLPIIWHSKNQWYPLFPRVDHHRGGVV